MKLYDCVVIGGGPAGISAAIYLARFNRRVLVIDQKHGRSTYPQINENFLGFPNGIPARKLRKLGQLQAEKFGAEFAADEAISVEKTGEVFEIKSPKSAYKARTIIIATGVKDNFSNYRDYKEYVGISLFWCIICDGYKAIHKRVMIIGNSNEAVTTCMQFLNFTTNLVFVTNQDKSQTKISPKKIEALKNAKIPFHEKEIGSIIGKNGIINSVRLSNGQIISIDLVFSEQGQKSNSEIARMLGVKLNEVGCIITDEKQHTNVPFVYAAGDVTVKYSQQILAAAHEGAIAAESANYDLYRPEQKE